jgi:hypothetical protein
MIGLPILQPTVPAQVNYSPKQALINLHLCFGTAGGLEEVSEVE